MPKPTSKLPGEPTLHWHLRELKAIEAELEADHIARPTIEARIEECKQAIEATR